MSDLSDSQFAAFVDRVINCREAEDRAKADTKQVYSEIADAGEDKAAIGLLVRELRASEKDRIKANLRDAAVEDGRARYRRGKASHVRAREDEPEHDADGVIIERVDDLGSVQDARKMSSDGQPNSEMHERASTDDEPSPEAGPQAQASHSQGTGAGTLADREARSTGEAASADLPTPSNVTAFRTHNPATHFLSSKGLPRLHGCRKPEACGGSHRALCFSCSVAHDGPAFQGGVA